jgi:hypothetical protein
MEVIAPLIGMLFLVGGVLELGRRASAEVATVGNACPPTVLQRNALHLNWAGDGKINGETSPEETTLTSGRRDAMRRSGEGARTDAPIHEQQVTPQYPVESDGEQDLVVEEAGLLTPEQLAEINKPLSERVRVFTPEQLAEINKPLSERVILDDR